MAERGFWSRLAGSLATIGLVQYYDSPRELLAALSAEGADAVVVGLRDGAGGSVVPAVAAVRESFPSVPIVAVCGLTPADCRELLVLGRAGVDDVVLRGYDDAASTLRDVLTRAEGARAAGDLLARARRLVPATLRPLLDHCLTRPTESLSVEVVAAALGVHRRTLVNRAAQAGLPSPGALVAWCRLLVAAQRMARPGRSVEQIALDLGFASAAALRKMLKRHTGLTPRDVRENGGAECILRAMATAIATGAAVQTPADVCALRPHWHAPVSGAAVVAPEVALAR